MEYDKSAKTVILNLIGFITSLAILGALIYVLAS